MMGVPIWQPWASLVAIGAKRIETRGKPAPSTIIGKRVAIHACLTPRELHRVGEGLYAEALMAGLRRGILAEVDDRLPLGHLLCTAVVEGTFRVTERYAIDLARDDPQEFAFGDYNTARERWGWVLADVERLPAPVPFRGSQGIFRVPDELVGVEPAPAVEQLELGA